jgi:protein-S-isoprenylcysteine O-methyltransferase Ste14
MVVWAAWLITVGVWIAMAAFGKGGKPTERSQDSTTRAIHIAALVGALLLLAFGPRWALYTPSLSLKWVGAFIATLGCAMAISARLRLGSNWSPHASLKSGQELIQTGAYAITRHPIYTGLLTALAATAISLGEVRGFAAFAVLAISFHYKASAEEDFLRDQFGARYEAYSQRVKRLVPFVW